MVEKDPNNSRVASASIDPMFTERWSNKSFSGEPLSDDQIASLFEAARWAPSARNWQPWVFVYATDGPERERFDALLFEGNKRWAPKASMMAFLFARKVSEDGITMRTNEFDCGAAWMSIALQAKKMGLNTRAIGAMELDGAYEVAGISSDDYEMVIAIAVGAPGSDDDLEPELAEINFANDRKAVSEFVFSGRFTG